MSLTAATISMAFGWTDSITPVSGGKAVRYNDSLALNPTIDISTYNRKLRNQFSVAGSGTQLIDLASFVDPLTGATIVLTKAIGLEFIGTQPFTLGPNNGANPLQWIWGGTTQTLRFAANEGFAAYSAVTFSTGSKLLLTNTGGSTGLFDVCILGGT